MTRSNAARSSAGDNRAAAHNRDFTLIELLVVVTSKIYCVYSKAGGSVTTTTSAVAAYRLTC